MRHRCRAPLRGLFLWLAGFHGFDRFLRFHEFLVALDTAEVLDVLGALRGEGGAQGDFLAADTAGDLIFRHLRTVWDRHGTPPSSLMQLRKSMLRLTQPPCN